MAYITYEIINNPETSDTEVLDRNLHEYNLTKIGEKSAYDYKKLAVFAKDANGIVLGGVYGELRWEWLHIKTLWIDKVHRKNGIGTRLLSTIESEAARRGFYNIHLETTSFQALGFYQKHGYEIFGILEGKPTGYNWYYLKKIKEIENEQVNQEQQ